MDESCKNALQRRITCLNILLGIQFSIYLIFRWVLENALAWDTSVLLILTLSFIILECLYSKNKFLHKISIVQMIRYIELVMITGVVILFPHDLFTSYIGVFFYFLIVIENVLITKVNMLTRKVFSVLLLLLPALISYGIKFLIIEITVFALLEAIGTLGFLYTVLMIATSYHAVDRSKQIEEELKEQKELNCKIKKMNDELMLKQEELERASEQMHIQNLIQRYISSSLEIEKTMELIAESLSEALVVNLCGIIVFQENKKDNIIVYGRTTFGEEYTKEFRGQIKDLNFVNEYGNVKEAYIDNNVDVLNYPFLQGQKIGSLLVFPLTKEDEWLGTLIIGKDSKEYFLNNMTFFETVGSQITIAIANAKIYRQVEKIAEKDGLTNIYNRRYLANQMDNFIRSSIYEKKALVVILFDIDKFKTINDTYGHVSGDEVIRQCARIAKKVATENRGIAARYGGEEFVVLFQDKDISHVKEIVENLHERIRLNKIQVNGFEIQIDVSIGVTSYPELCPDPTELLNRADWAMYHSKRNGRGRITYDNKLINKTM